MRKSIANIVNSLPEEKNEDTVITLKENKPSCGKRLTEYAAHLFREVCDCGRMKLWTKRKTSNQGCQDHQKLLNSATENSLVFDTPSTENRPDKLGSIIIIIVTVFTILFLFWIKNSDMIMKVIQILKVELRIISIIL